MKRLLTFFVILLFAVPVSSQGERNKWYFGNMAGLDFNNGAPVALTNGALFTYDNCTSVSDNAGNILLYSNGVDVWNRNHVVMPNGSGLLGHTSGGNSAFAVQQPGSTNIYLFTNDAVAGANGLCYSIIDMNLQSGLGDVTSVKNVSLLNPATEKIAAVKHANNTDIWIIAHGWNSNTFYAYLLTNSGLSLPVLSSVGATQGGYNYNAMGQLSVSPAGDKIAGAVYDIGVYELFDFDNATGILSNAMTIGTTTHAWGMEFSPDGSRLYATHWFYDDIYQFDLSSNNATTIANSITTIGHATSPDGTYKAGYLQLGPDNKIYVAKFTDTYVGVINTPNALGTACNFVDNGVYLGGRQCEAGLPSFLKTTSAINPKGISTYTKEEGSLGVYPNPSGSLVHVELPLIASNESLLVMIYNSSGQLVYTSDISPLGEEQKTFSVDVSNFAAGLYFIQAQQGNSVFTGRIEVTGHND